MKKRILFTLAVLTRGALNALPLGNPVEASLFTNGLWIAPSCCYDPCDPCFNWCEAWNVRAGFYGDYVYNRYLKVESSNLKLQDTEICTNSGYLAINFCNRMDVFSTLGETEFHLRQDAFAFGSLLSIETEIAIKPAFSWSVGVRAALWECDPISLGIEGQYFKAGTEIDHLTNYATGSKIYFDHIKAQYCEWQIGFGISYRLATFYPRYSFIPYAGIKYSHAHFDFDSASAEGILISDLISRKPWGIAFGLSFTLNEISDVTIEARFGDEKALYFNGQFRF